MLPKRKIREHTEFLKTFQTGTPRREWIEDLRGGEYKKYKTKHQEWVGLGIGFRNYGFQEEDLKYLASKEFICQGLNEG